MSFNQIYKLFPHYSVDAFFFKMRLRASTLYLNLDVKNHKGNLVVFLFYRLLKSSLLINISGKYLTLDGEPSILFFSSFIPNLSSAFPICTVV